MGDLSSPERSCRLEQSPAKCRLVRKTIPEQMFAGVMTMIKFATALVAACLVAVPATAFAGEREAVSLRVPTAGVDFAKPAAVEAFRSNVERQIAAACEPADRVGGNTMPDFKCRREMAASLAPAVTELAARAVSGRSFATN